VSRDPNPEEAEALDKLMGDAQTTAAGRKLEKSEFQIWNHPDGRQRMVTFTEEPASSEAVALDANAFVVLITLRTSSIECDSGI
jgi:hypothetical protein